MKNSFIDLLRQPNSILFQYEDSDIRFEEPVSREEQSSKIDYIVENGAGKVILYPADKAVKRVKLRWRGDMSDVLMVMGDDYDRGMGNIKWIGLTPERQMPWYFHAFDGERLNCFGVKTGANAFCFFQCDPCGITLWIDVRNGGGGVVTLASVTPGILTPEQLKRIQGIYRIASQGGLGAVPTDWLEHNTMSSFETPDGRKFNFDWYRVHEGVRTFYGWYR